LSQAAALVDGRAYPETVVLAKSIKERGVHTHVAELISNSDRAYFDHIPKTGGTACYEYFRSCMGDEHVSPFVLFELAPDALARHSDRALISGHFEPLPGSLPADRFTFTILRDPIERTLSEYSAILFDEAMNPGEEFEAIRRARNAPLIELLLDDDPRISIIFRNRQTKHFAGYAHSIDRNTTEIEMLGYAKEALTDFDLVGVYDDMAGFLDLSCERLGIPIPNSLPRRNVTSRKICFSSLSSREQELLADLNRADIDLVNFAREQYREVRRETMRRLVRCQPVRDDLSTTEIERGRRTRNLQRQRGPAEFGTYEVEIVAVAITGNISNLPEVFSGENTTIQVRFRSRVDEPNLTVGLRIVDDTGRLVYGTNTYHQGTRIEVSAGADYFIDFSFGMNLGLGEYGVGVTIHTGAEHTSRCFHWKDSAARFAVVGNIEEHFEGITNICVSVSGGTSSPGRSFKIVPREAGPLKTRSLVVHSPRVINPTAVVTVSEGFIEAQPEEVFSVRAVVINAGREAWPAGGTRPVHCSYHVYDNNGKCITHDGIRTRLRGTVGENQTVTLNVAVVAPRDEGTYQIEIDLVQELVSWFKASGSNRLTLNVARSEGSSQLVNEMYSENYVK
jgi:hypothetical protein